MSPRRRAVTIELARDETPTSQGTATDLSINNHASHHTLGKIKARQIGLCDFSPALADLDGTLDIFVLAGERTLALGVVEAIIILVPLVLEGPQLLLLSRRGIGRQNSLVARAVQAGIALKICAELAQTAARGQNLLDERRERGVLGACAVENGADEQEQQGAGGEEEKRQDLRGTGAAAPVDGLVLALLDNPHLLHQHVGGWVVGSGNRGV